MMSTTAQKLSKSVSISSVTRPASSGSRMPPASWSLWIENGSIAGPLTKTNVMLVLREPATWIVSVAQLPEPVPEPEHTNRSQHVHYEPGQHLGTCRDH